MPCKNQAIKTSNKPTTKKDNEEKLTFQPQKYIKVKSLSHFFLNQVQTTVALAYKEESTCLKTPLGKKEKHVSHLHKSPMLHLLHNMKLHLTMKLHQPE